MNLLYVTLVSPSVSVYTKTRDQVAAFEQLATEGVIENALSLRLEEGLEVTSVWCGGLYLGSLKRGSKRAALYNTLIGQPKLYRNIARIVRLHEIDTIYIRKPIVIDFPLAMLLWSLYREGRHVIFEIPTYPYLPELRGHAVLRMLDWSGRWAISRFVTRAVTVTHHDYALGAPAVSISNGVDLKRVPLASSPVNDGIKTFVCVAGFAPWHRIERLLNAVSRYYSEGGTTELIIKMIGGGPSKASLEAQVLSDPALTDRVIFFGALHGAELDAQFDNADLGIGNLEEAATRRLREVAPLKHREYAARGIPFIYGLTDSDFSEAQYALQVPDGGINLIGVLAWLDSLTINREEIRTDARRLGWAEQLGMVLRTLREDSKP